MSWTGPTERVGTGGTDPLTEFLRTMRSVEPVYDTLARRITTLRQGKFPVGSLKLALRTKTLLVSVPLLRTTAAAWELAAL